MSLSPSRVKGVLSQEDLTPGVMGRNMHFLGNAGRAN